MAINATINNETTHLVSMANDIAVNLRLHADADERTTQHMKKFWTPRMRSLLLDYAQAGGSGLSTTLTAALKKLAKA